MITEANRVEYIIEYEEGTLGAAESVELFQHLVDTELAWKLQGHYGRTAEALIERGLVKRKTTAPTQNTVAQP